MSLSAMLDDFDALVIQKRIVCGETFMRNTKLFSLSSSVCMKPFIAASDYVGILLASAIICVKFCLF